MKTSKPKKLKNAPTSAAAISPDPELVEQVKELNVKLSKQLSFKRSILLAVVSGAGYAIGATLVAGILVTLLSTTINSIEDVPVLNNLIRDFNSSSSNGSNR